MKVIQNSEYYKLLSDLKAIIEQIRQDSSLN